MQAGDTSPILLWFRRDFRLSDHPALAEAARQGRPVIPVCILDEVVEGYGAAPKWRWGEAVAHFSKTLQALGSRLILRRGRALGVLQQLVQETGAGDVWWTRAYDPDAIARDTDVKSTLQGSDIVARSFPGLVLFEPWTVTTKAGGFFKVYSPMWRAVRGTDVPVPDPAPRSLMSPANWPVSDHLDTWALGAAMNRGAGVLAQFACVGEGRAHDRLTTFLAARVDDYAKNRDFPSMDATSRLSENLAWGEIGPRTIWHAGQRVLQEGRQGAEKFLKELVWREFAHHLIYHTPHIVTDNWRPEWDSFPWSEEEDVDVLRWKQGRTGIPLVDAAMRELYVTGTMHNRGRMIVGSYLTKHMMTHWRIGQRWFQDCLIDWDPAANAMGWQWVAGSGPDAAPYFRVFNPETQASKFDGDRTYINTFVAELSPQPSPQGLAFYQACPQGWALCPSDLYPNPVVELAEGRRRALDAYAARE
ncbi:Deoxyribodipyrimidine photo-lyase [Falsiruegeria litorea R37]|uniref:Deoxyribodipyrimidine photo-lyase n=1 Tax=Falsiruegeria litorea R37 TaxID=1200284 RepID=A0A1Y5S5J5_9RHOB|nr:deoxyribodipyrimidine photo-lyase [Falsiruegeria litorea]SLN30277.1 Deoxyribodipyrimidine photo-lyase [Falsiruegeria litorea R37]